MAYTRDSLPSNHGEFSGGPGLIDPEVRKDRVGMTNTDKLLEMYATNPDPPSTAHGDTDEEMTARAAAIALENDPQTTPLPRIVVED